MYFSCGCIVLSTSFGSSNNAYIGKKGIDFSSFGVYISSGSRRGNGPNELVHKAGPPFLDNHYCGYQYILVVVCELYE